MGGADCVYSSGSLNGTLVNGSGTVSGSSSGGFVAHHIHGDQRQPSLNTETVNEARVAVRLVDPMGMSLRPHPGK